MQLFVPYITKTTNQSNNFHFVISQLFAVLYIVLLVISIYFTHSPCEWRHLLHDFQTFRR